jgi:hypothetical protein
MENRREEKKRDRKVRGEGVWYVVYDLVYRIENMKNKKEGRRRRNKD